MLINKVRLLALLTSVFLLVVALIEVTTRKDAHLVQTISNTSAVYDIAFSPNGERIASGDYDGMITFWNIHTAQASISFQAHQQAVTSLSFTPDGSIIASCGADGVVTLWRSDTGEAIATLASENDATNPFFDVTFSHNGLYIAASDMNGSIWLWDVQTKKLMRKFQGHASIGISSAVYSISVMLQ